MRSPVLTVVLEITTRHCGAAYYLDPEKDRFGENLDSRQPSS